MIIKQTLKWGIGVLFIVVLTACIPDQGSAVPAQQITVPPDKYGIVLRFPEDKLLLSTGSADSWEYYVFGEDRFIKIPFKKDNRCRQNEYTIPRSLPDGKLGFNMICSSYWSDRPIGQDSARFIMAYDCRAIAF